MAWRRLSKGRLSPKGFVVDDASLEDIMLFYTAKDTAALLHLQGWLSQNFETLASLLAPA